jgi:hypothetical protein
MKEPTLDELCQAFRAHGVQAPPEYVWLVQHRTLGFNAFSQLEPWQFCNVEEILPLSTRWPAAAIKRELIPFARRQGSDDLACFEFVEGRVTRICHIHYNLGKPVYVEFHKEYATIWDWLKAVLGDMKVWLELEQDEGTKARVSQRTA